MEKSLIDCVKNFLTEIEKKYEIELAYIFGSVARGKARKDSDIDIAIKFRNNFTDREDAFIRGEIIDKGKIYFGREVDIVSLDKASLALKYEIVKDGIVLWECSSRSTFESLTLREYFDFKYYSDIYNQKIIENIKNEKYFKENLHGR